MTPTTEQGAGLVLRGLDGSNPLAFLAALGTLRTVTLAAQSPNAPDWVKTGVTMYWRRAGVTWAPVLHSLSGNPLGEEALLDAIESSMAKDIKEHPLSVLGAKEAISAAATQCVENSTAQNRESGADWLSAVYCDLAPEATNQVQTVRRDYFFGNLDSVIANTKRDHLRRTLFATWDYADPLENQSLHIEPSEDRRHAHQWHMPSGDPTRGKRGGMLGANRLAIEALPLLQSFAVGGKLATRGFSGRRAHNTRWTWPIWSCPLGLFEIACLLALPELQSETVHVTELRTRGIVAVFRSRRFLVEKTPNFSPAVAVF